MSSFNPNSDRELLAQNREDEGIRQKANEFLDMTNPARPGLNVDINLILNVQVSGDKVQVQEATLTFKSGLLVKTAKSGWRTVDHLTSAKSQSIP